jgi:hypothetical protein
MSTAGITDRVPGQPPPSRRTDMTLYSLALFIHVSADIGIFIGLGLQLFCLAALRRAGTVEQARGFVQLIHGSQPLSVVSALLTIAAGLYMALTVWDWRSGWILAALASIIVLLPPLIAGLIEPRLRAMTDLLKTAAPGPLSVALRARIHDPILGTALQTAAAVVLGIVFLMTTKPSLAGSSLVMGVFVALGLAASLPLWRAGLKRETPR